MWWIHARRVTRQRQATKALYALSESLVAAYTPADIATIVRTLLPPLVGATGANLYLANRAAKTLTRVPAAGDNEMLLISLTSPAPGLGNAVAACARNRSTLAVPDTRQTPLVGPATDDLPRSVLLLPLVSHEELLGVLEVHRADQPGGFAPEAQAAAQHVGNQIAAAVKLQEQRSLQQHLHQGEKLAATGQMLAGIARELRAPLDAIVQSTAGAVKILKRRDDIPAAEAELARVATEAARTQEIVSRMIAFTGSGPVGPQVLDLTALVQRVMRSREALWQEQAIEAQVRIETGPLSVMGIEPALEQLLLICCQAAEQRASAQSGRTLVVSLTEVQSRARVEIGHTLPPGVPVVEESGEGPSEVCRSIVQTHGGELRQHLRAGIFSCEFTLPCVPAPTLTEPAPKLVAEPPLTVMLVDAEPASSRPLVKLLAKRGHRVVPVAGEEAAEVAPRLHFDAVFWAARAGRGGWGEALDSVRSSIQSFVVISDGYNQDLAASLEQNGAFLLSRPVEEASLDRILAAIAGRQP